MSAGSRCLVIGLKGSGKTTFLAALWHLIESNELPARLTVPALQPDRKYLNRIRESWLRFEEVGRTPLVVDETLALVLKDSQSGELFDVSYPDMSGESLRLQWATRHATIRYSEQAKVATGLFLFVHPDTVRKAPRIGTEISGPPGQVPAAGTEEGTVKVSMPTELQEKLTDWSVELAPTQVQLVELLQFVHRFTETRHGQRIAVVISAWDLVKDNASPSSWVERSLPLLFQFLVANSDARPFSIFGVSAQGGDLKTDLARLQSEFVPARRIRVVNDNLEESHDLTAPLRFLLGPTA